MGPASQYEIAEGQESRVAACQSRDRSSETFSRIRKSKRHIVRMQSPTRVTYNEFQKSATRPEAREVNRFSEKAKLPFIPQDNPAREDAMVK